MYTPIILGKCSQAEFTVPELHQYSGHAISGHHFLGEGFLDLRINPPGLVVKKNTRKMRLFLIFRERISAVGPHTDAA